MDSDCCYQRLATDGCSSETRSPSNGCSSDTTIRSDTTATLPSSIGPINTPSWFTMHGVQWESPGTPRSLKTSRTGSTATTAAPRSPGRLGREFTAELWNTHLLQKAIGETINLDRKHIAARADEGVSPTFRISAKRQAFPESSTNTHVCDSQQSSRTSEDPARRLLDSMVEDSRNFSLHSSSGSKPSSRASSIQVHPGIRNRTDTSIDLTISLGIHKLNELARKRGASPPRSPVPETAVRCASPRSSPRSSSCSVSWPDAKKLDNSFKWPEPKKLVSMVEDDVDIRYKHVQRAKSPRGSSLQVLPSVPDTTQNFLEFAAPSPRQSPQHSPRYSSRRTFSRGSSGSCPSMPVESVSDAWKAHRDQERESSHSSSGAFRRIHDDVHKVVETVGQNTKRASASSSTPSSRSPSRIRMAAETPPTAASATPPTKDSSSDCVPSLQARIETVSGLQDRIESLLKVAREKQASMSLTPAVARSSSQQPSPTVGVAPNLATAQRATSRSRSTRSESPSQRSSGRAFTNSHRSDLQSTRMARGAAPPPRVVPFPQRF